MNRFYNESSHGEPCDNLMRQVPAPEGWENRVEVGPGRVVVGPTAREAAARVRAWDQAVEEAASFGLRPCHGYNPLAKAESDALGSAVVRWRGQRQVLEDLERLLEEASVASGFGKDGKGQGRNDLALGRYQALSTAVAYTRAQIQREWDAAILR